ncbi:MAG: DUF4410 domain-containing protein [Burkholderiaceae bacterium]|nr:DUF4410 domain-containing protein [Burkholderiaceae bacterium]
MMRAIQVLLVAASLLVAGCAATVQRDTAQPQTLSMSAAAPRTLLAQLEGAGQVGKSSDWSRFVQRWQESLSAAAAEKELAFNLLEHDAPLPGASAVLARIRVNDFRYVSNGARQVFGILTGNAHLDVDVEFIELPSGEPLGVRHYRATSSTWQGVFSAMTPKQVEAVAQEIVLEVAGR